MSPSSLPELGARVRSASRLVARAPSGARGGALTAAAGLLESESAQVLAANRRDRERAEQAGAEGTPLDRLTLDEARLGAMAEALRTVAALADPVGEVVDRGVRPNGLRVRRVRVPLGVVGVIYENRPNVTSDAAALCLKAGNAAFLRGSSAALRSNVAIVALLRRGLAEAGLPEDAVTLVEETSHRAAIEFMQLRGIIDCLVPRGGPALVGSLLEHATVPYVLDGEGNCHVFVDESADLAMAEEIVTNAKTQRPGVCNAVESLLVHRAVAEEFLPRLAKAMPEVTLRCDERAHRILPAAEPAGPDDFGREYLGLMMSVAVVDDLAAAVDHIDRFGSGHSEAIVTRDAGAAERFAAEVDAAAVVVNASTRFVDGAELGLGAEVGISTQKLHARGPMGLRELTCTKWVVSGDGQVRR